MNSNVLKEIRDWIAIIVLTGAATIAFASWVLAADDYNVAKETAVEGAQAKWFQRMPAAGNL